MTPTIPQSRFATRNSGWSGKTGDGRSGVYGGVVLRPYARSGPFAA